MFGIGHICGYLAGVCGVPDPRVCRECILFNFYAIKCHLHLGLPLRHSLLPFSFVLFLADPRSSSYGLRWQHQTLLLNFVIELYLTFTGTLALHNSFISVCCHHSVLAPYLTIYIFSSFYSSPMGPTGKWNSICQM